MKAKYLTLLLVTILFSCKSGKESNSMKALESGTFQVTTINGQQLSTDDVTIQIDLEEHRISGDTGCNTFGADFIEDGIFITMSYARVTKQYCKDKMKLERLFLHNLGEVTSYIYNGQKLRLQSQEGKTVILATKLMDKD